MLGQHSLTLSEVMMSELRTCPSRTRICKSGSTYFFIRAIYRDVNLYELSDIDVKTMLSIAVNMPDIHYDANVDWD